MFDTSWTSRETEDYIQTTQRKFVDSSKILMCTTEIDILFYVLQNSFADNLVQVSMHVNTKRLLLIHSWKKHLKKGTEFYCLPVWNSFSESESCHQIMLFSIHRNFLFPEELFFTSHLTPSIFTCGLKNGKY